MIHELALQVELQPRFLVANGVATIKKSVASEVVTRKKYVQPVKFSGPC
jgi:hypothetical protein